MIPRENFQQVHQQHQGMISSRTVRFSIENARTQFKQKEFAEAILNYIAVLKNQSNDIRLKYLDEYLGCLRAFLCEEINVYFYFNYKINLTFSQDSYVKDILQISSSIYGSEFRFFRVEAEYHFQQGSKNDNQKKILKFFKGKLLKSLEIFEKSKKFAKTNLERLINLLFF